MALLLHKQESRIITKIDNYECSRKYIENYREPVRDQSNKERFDVSYLFSCQKY